MTSLRILLAMIVALTITACAAQGARQADSHDQDSYSGWVTDAVSGQPTPGAVVVAAWYIERRQSFMGVEGTKSIEVVRLEEMVTDEQGRFRFEPIGNYTPPAGWGRGAFPILHFFKPGYEPKGIGRIAWEHGEGYGLPIEPQLQGRPPRRLGWQREVQLYRYLARPLTQGEAADPIYRQMTDTQKIMGRLTNFARALAENVEFSSATLGETVAVQTQWRAIAMVDDEIRKYQPDFHWWNRPIEQALASGGKGAKQ
jgi:hypothetical protein